MPRTKRTPPLTTRLAGTDLERFRRMAKAKGLTQAELMREALRAYMDWQEAGDVLARESLIEKRLKRMEDRLAALLARIGMDVGWVFSFLWFKGGQDQSLSDACAKRAHARIVNKLDVMEDEYIDLVAQKVFRTESMSDVQAQIVKSLKEQVLTEIRNDQNSQPDKT